MDVGAPEVGLIATAITTLARPGPKESRRGGDHSLDSSRGFFSGRQSMIPAVLRLGGGSDTFCLVDNVL